MEIKIKTINRIEE